MINQITILFGTNAFCAINYSLIAPLFPLQAQEKGVSDTLIGIIFASFAISNVIVIPSIPFLVSKLGRKTIFVTGITLEGICTFIYGIIHFIPSKFFFVLVSFILRLLQGTGCALSSTLIYSIAASSSDEDSMKKNMGYMELADSIGLTIGPLVASFFYHFFGYSCPFFLCGIMMGICLKFSSYLNISEELNHNNNPNFFSVLKNLSILLSFFAVIMDMMSTTFIYPVFSTHLKNKFDLSVEKSSFFFVIQMFTYFMALQYLDRISSILGAKLTMSVGMLFNFGLVLFISPVSFLPQKIYLIIIGLVGLGGTGALITIPAIVDLMDETKEYLDLEESIANDYASGLYNLAINLAESIGPIIGGTLTDKKDFGFACSCISISNLVFLFIFAGYNMKTIKVQLIEGEKEDEEDTDKKETNLFRQTKKFSRQFSIHSRYSLPNKIGRSRSSVKSLPRLSHLSDF